MVAERRAGSPLTVALQDVHVVYRVQEDVPLRGLAAARRGFKGRAREVHAVRGVSLLCSGGETIGVVGRNGSGKSSLLKALAGLLPIDRGTVHARSRPTLLGVGNALQPQISGARNVLLGCMALGLSREESRQRFREIVDFAGIGDAIDRPMRTYSSGMRARLLFSIATAVTRDILIIDEALSVGDEDFRARSRERIEELRARAGTVLLVSHNLKQLEQTCTRVVWLDEGRIKADGPPAATCREYRQWTVRCRQLQAD